MIRSAERKLKALNTKIATLDEEIRLVYEELSFHQHLADDAARDAAVYDDPIERENAAMTSGDVHRFETRLAKLRKKREMLESRRMRLSQPRP